MRLSSLSVANFRCFPTRNTIRLAPLTLLYGWNNVGKSALVRLLAMVGEGVAESAASPLDPGAIGASEGGFAALRWKGDPALAESSGITVGLEWEGATGPISAEYLLDYSDTQRQTYIRALELTTGDAAPMRLEANPVTRQYDRVVSGDSVRRSGTEVSFVGLVPQNDQGLLAPLRAALLSLRGRVQWLSSVRVKPPRLMAPSGASPKRLRPDGQGAVEVLLTNDAVRKRVTAWYRTASEREFVLTDALQGGHRMLLRPAGTTMDVDLVDGGEGMVQCLPVVTAAAMLETPDGPRVLAVEEPESHLHPRAQRELAQLLCEVARGPTRPTIVVETHSFTVMLGVQLAIANGMSPDDVRVYWLEPTASGVSKVREICFDEAGRPRDPAPSGVFAVETDLAQDLAEKQMRR